jgi:flagellar biosynthesis protein FliR
VVKFSSFAWTMGVIGLILYSFRQINVFYLSAPIFVLIWLVIAIIWLISVLNFWLRVAPKRRKEINQNAEKKYYMP